MGLKEIVGKVFLNQNPNKDVRLKILFYFLTQNRKNATSESALRKRNGENKGKSMCFQSVSRENTMIKIIEKGKHSVDCKYNPSFNLLEKKP